MNGNGVLKIMVVFNFYVIGYILFGIVDILVYVLVVNGVEVSVDNVKNGIYKVFCLFFVFYK